MAGFLSGGGGGITRARDPIISDCQVQKLSAHRFGRIRAILDRRFIALIESTLSWVYIHLLAKGAKS